MDHRKIKELISSYYEGGLGERERKIVEGHLRTCPDCRSEFEGMNKFEEVMNKMELKQPSKEVWQLYWSSVYNRLERRVGWILLSLGSIILVFFGGYKMIEGLINDTSTPILLKAGILAALGGVAILLVSLIRERIFVRRRERYKEVEK